VFHFFFFTFKSIKLSVNLCLHGHIHDQPAVYIGLTKGFVERVIRDTKLVDQLKE
jgi:hypothetical protein